jgi:hypothetical protein
MVDAARQPTFVMSLPRKSTDTSDGHLAMPEATAMTSWSVKPLLDSVSIRREVLYATVEAEDGETFVFTNRREESLGTDTNSISTIMSIASFTLGATTSMNVTFSRLGCPLRTEKNSLVNESVMAQVRVFVERIRTSNFLLQSQGGIVVPQE